MRTFVESLSLTSGAFFIAVVSSAVVWILCRVSPGGLPKLWIFAVPAVFTVFLYWSPVWFAGEPGSEYSTWQFAFYVPWFLAGAIPSALVVRFLISRE